jgi:hypothetical protein
MNKKFPYQQPTDQEMTIEFMKQVDAGIIPKEARKALSHKEKYGKCKTKGSKAKFKPIKNGFYTCISSEMPVGYNSCLGYCTETVTAAQRKQEYKYL